MPEFLLPGDCGLCWLEGQGRDGVPSAVLVVWWLCSWCFAFIVPGEGGESDGRWTHSAVSQAPAEHGAVCMVL